MHISKYSSLHVRCTKIVALMDFVQRNQEAKIYLILPLVISCYFWLE